MSGKLQSVGEYKNGKLEGKYVIYYPSGKTYMTSDFVNGLHNGDINYYYENGNPLLRGILQNGKSVGNFEFYSENGKLEFRALQRCPICRTYRRRPCEPWQATHIRPRKAGEMACRWRRLQKYRPTQIGRASCRERV